MTPTEFAAKWRGVTTGERASAQSHFLDLCAMLGWLNPPGLDPDKLGKRTLTNLYNARPTGLEQAHAALDRPVLAAYGWPEDLTGEPLLAALLALNLQREPA